ncbi:hypothetical protein, partial [Leptospira wolffii]|uniref:hypothetical protein n=1 Tax=Leptospira wolffii TaxID=409998 RepID=UPI001AEFC697
NKKAEDFSPAFSVEFLLQTLQSALPAAEPLGSITANESHCLLIINMDVQFVGAFFRTPLGVVTT